MTALGLSRSDRWLRFVETLKIRSRDRHIIPLRYNDPQQCVWQRVHGKIDRGEPIRLIVLKARRTGICLAPSTRVLMADLTWRPIADIVAGEAVVSVDEELPQGRRGRRAARKMRVAIVRERRDVVQPAFHLLMEDGRDLVATGPHRFLCRQRGGTDTHWRAVEAMRPGDVIRTVTAPWSRGDDADGWFAGFVDGEGTLRPKRRAGCELTLTQLPGVVYDRALAYLKDRAAHVRASMDDDRRASRDSDGDHRTPIGRLVVGRMHELVRWIGQTRPSRLPTAWWQDQDLPGKKFGMAWVNVRSVTPIGIKEMVDLQTSTKTFIAEGLVSHNSTEIESWLLAFIASGDLVHANVTAHTSKASKRIWAMSKLFVETSPLLSRLADVQPGAHSIRLGRSMLNVSTAGSPDAERSGDLTAVHLCLAGDTLVRTQPFGLLVPISGVRVGDRVLTHTRADALVTATSVRQAPVVDIHLASLPAQPLRCTPEHKLWTRGGWKEASALRSGDCLGVPLPVIKPSVTDIVLRQPPTPRRQHGGREFRPVRSHVPVNADLGWMLGWYLAKGSVIYQSEPPRHVSAVTFTVDRDDVATVQQALEPFCGCFSSVSVGVKPSRTRAVTVYGRQVAEMIVRLCGAGREKHLPEQWWTYGESFVRALVLGYLAGDGSRGTFQTRMITATSIRGHLTFDVRDALAALGYGWASVGFRRGGVRYGRHEQDAWTLRLCGRGVDDLVEPLGVRMPPRRRFSRGRTHGVVIQDGYAWLSIRSVVPGAPAVVYSLEVDHPDHSFCIVPGAVANSEVAYWPHPDAMLAILQALPQGQRVFSIAVIESTANGRVGEGELFYTEWQRAVAGESGWDPVFLPWHSFAEYQMPGLTVEDLDVEERALRERFELSDAQLAWRRWCIASNCQGDLDKWHQEYPDSPEVAFVQSGLPFFRLEHLLPLEQDLRAGERVDVEPDGSVRRSPQGIVEVWRWPEPGHSYVIGADSSMGLDDRDGSREHSRSGACVLDMETQEQVAEYDAATPPHVFARHLAGLGRLYYNALLAPEVQSSGGGGGREILVYLRDLEYWNIHRWRHVDKVERDPGRLLGWETTSRTRPRMLARVREVVMERSSVIHSRRLYQQLSAFGESDAGYLQALAGRDDLLFAYGIALMSRSENYFVMPSDVGREPSAEPDWRPWGLRVTTPESPHDHLRRILALDALPRERGFLEM